MRKRLPSSLLPAPMALMIVAPAACACTASESLALTVSTASRRSYSENGNSAAFSGRKKQRCRLQIGLRIDVEHTVAMTSPSPADGSLVVGATIPAIDVRQADLVVVDEVKAPTLWLRRGLLQA